MVNKLLKRLSAAAIILIGLQLFYAQKSRWKVQGGIGFSSTDVNWSIAGNQQGTSPNILSEVVWTKLKGTNYNIQTDYEINQQLGLSFVMDYNDIDKGSGNDSDYAEDNRKGNFNNIDFSSNQGYTYNIQVKANYSFPKFSFFVPKLSLGLEQLKQKLYMNDTQGSDTGLNSTYRTVWNGGSMGVSIEIPIKSFYISGEYEFGIYDYSAQANWNLKEDLQKPISFRHDALGFKHEIKLLAGYNISDHFDIGLSLNRYYRVTNTGTDQLYLVTGEEKISQFNGIEFKQFTGGVYLKYKW
ncbi:TPA: outer membrane beta-barrel protein [Elizabethkingia anophelis]